MHRLVIGTTNPGKVREISALVADLLVEIVSASSLDLPEVVEDGATFRENAHKKAAVFAASTGCWALSDDSGLEVIALGGAPGVRSARYAGAGATDAENNALLLQQLAGIADRRARFVSEIALVYPNGRSHYARGECHGLIIDGPRGSGGFGYDPLFLVPEYGQTFAEMDPALKNRISHRAKALAGLRPILEELFGRR
ncbi:MAG: RdgB/HAM1 family non-canonical purine NTP pyrophosphatase [Bacillota bacterium]